MCQITTLSVISSTTGKTDKTRGDSELSTSYPLSALTDSKVLPYLVWNVRSFYDSFSYYVAIESIYLASYKKIQQNSVEYPHLPRMIEEDEVRWNNDQFSFFHHKSPKHSQFTLLIKHSTINDKSRIWITHFYFTLINC